MRRPTISGYAATEPGRFTFLPPPAGAGEMESPVPAPQRRRARSWTGAAPPRHRRPLRPRLRPIDPVGICGQPAGAVLLRMRRLGAGRVRAGLGSGWRRLPHRPLSPGQTAGMTSGVSPLPPDCSVPVQLRLCGLNNDPRRSPLQRPHDMVFQGRKRLLRQNEFSDANGPCGSAAPVRLIELQSHSRRRTPASAARSRATASENAHL